MTELITDEKGYVNIRDWMPQNERPLILKTKYGKRRAINGRFVLGGFYLTDCTHPLQNCHMSAYDVISWKYEDKNDFEDFPPIKNTWMRESEGREVLRQIKSKRIVSNGKKIDFAIGFCIGVLIVLVAWLFINS